MQQFLFLYLLYMKVHTKILHITSSICRQFTTISCAFSRAPQLSSPPSLGTLFCLSMHIIFLSHYNWNGMVLCDPIGFPNLCLSTTMCPMKHSPLVIWWTVDCSIFMCNLCGRCHHPLEGDLYPHTFSHPCHCKHSRPMHMVEWWIAPHSGHGMTCHGPWCRQST